MFRVSIQRGQADPGSVHKGQVVPGGYVVVDVRSCLGQAGPQVTLLGDATVEMLLGSHVYVGVQTQAVGVEQRQELTRHLGRSGGSE